MNRAEQNQLETIASRLNVHSAACYVLHDALASHGSDETAAIELVLKQMSYDLAALHEELEKMGGAA